MKGKKKWLTLAVAALVAAATVLAPPSVRPLVDLLAAALAGEALPAK